MRERERERVCKRERERERPLTRETKTYLPKQRQEREESAYLVHSGVNRARVYFCDSQTVV